jgi:hypothetical protein
VKFCRKIKAPSAAIAAAMLFVSTPLADAQSVFDDAVAYWAFEGTEDTIVDTKNVADMTIADASSPVRIAGLVGGGLQVNAGDQQYATTGVDVDALDFNRENLDSFSVAGWVKQYDGSTVFLKMADTSADNYRGWHLMTGDNGSINFLLRSTNLESDKISVTGNGRIPMGEWVHLAATFSYDVWDEMRGARIYVNGSQYDTTLTCGGLADDGFALLDTTNDKPFQFTAREDREYLHYEASFDEVGVWNRALSQDEIQQLVDAGVPVAPKSNFISNGAFEDTTGWDPAGTDVEAPTGWATHINKNNPATQATGTAAVGGSGASALMEGALLGGWDRRGMAQSFVHPTDGDWTFDMDFATEAPSDSAQRTIAMTLRAENGAQLAFIVSDPDGNGMGDLMVGDGGYQTITGLENKIVFDDDLSDLTGAVHHLKITGHFDDATPNWDITLTDPSGNEYTALGLTNYSSDMGELITGVGLSQVAFYTYKSYGDWVIDNVSLVDPSCAVVDVPGDANHDGSVNEIDAQALATNWGRTNAEWEDGDFNDDGMVNVEDAAILAANWGTVSGESTSVPEPSGAILLLVVAGGLCLRRRNHY